MHPYIIIAVILLILLVVLLFTLRSKSVTYFIHPSEFDDSFYREVSDILRNSPIRDKFNIQEIYDSKAADINIYLMRRRVMEHMYPRFNQEFYPGTNKVIHFSVTGQMNEHSKKPYIHIDEFNWKDGVSESGLTVDQYRQYVIQHEFMHALGYDHQACNEITAINGVCPILFQSTRGCPAGFKCGYQVTEQDYTKKLPHSYIQDTLMISPS